MLIAFERFLTDCKLDRETAELWVSHEWLMPQRDGTLWLFSTRDVARATFIRDLKHDFGVNDEGIDIILHLTDQLHGTRAVLKQLQVQMFNEQAP